VVVKCIVCIIFGVLSGGNFDESRSLLLDIYDIFPATGSGYHHLPVSLILNVFCSLFCFVGEKLPQRWLHLEEKKVRKYYQGRSYKTQGGWR